MCAREPEGSDRRSHQGTGNDEGSFRFLADPGSSTTQEGDWYLARLTQCEPCVVLMDPLEESLLCPLSVTWLSPRSGGGPAPGLWGSLTRLFPRYVQEVIQRGRSCVRPACTPMLSVVPAVSDMELSETEYVRPPAGLPAPPTQPSLWARPQGAAAVPRAGAWASHGKSWGCQLPTGLSFLSLHQRGH